MIIQAAAIGIAMELEVRPPSLTAVTGEELALADEALLDLVFVVRRVLTIYLEVKLGLEGGNRCR